MTADSDVVHIKWSPGSQVPATELTPNRIISPAWFLTMRCTERSVDILCRGWFVLIRTVADSYWFLKWRRNICSASPWKHAVANCVINQGFSNGALKQRPSLGSFAVISHHDILSIRQLKLWRPRLMEVENHRYKQYFAVAYAETFHGGVSFSGIG